jgi:glycerol-3-phosphate dehydrogenase (NAD(P)+)
MAGHPTALVAASPFEAVQEATVSALHSARCRVYTTDDLCGVQLAGAMVGALAIAVGVADGVDFGIGAKGVIITRGIAEASRLGDAIGADARTFSGLAGVGDLVSCASSPLHPGFAAGRSLAEGGAVSSHIILQLRALLALSRRVGVDLPLTTAVLAIATGESRPKRVFDELMRRAARPE